jgi:hypothetical protein
MELLMRFGEASNHVTQGRMDCGLQAAKKPRRIIFSGAFHYPDF